MELLAFLASLEAKKIRNQVDNQFDVEEVVGEEDVILLECEGCWNVRGLNCPFKRVSVR